MRRTLRWTPLAVLLHHAQGRLEVQILLPSQESGRRYEVQVMFPHGSGVQAFAGLAPEGPSPQRRVHFDLSAAGLLLAGLYTFRLYRVAGIGKIFAAYHVVLAQDAKPVNSN
jgi:hypothetical protein